MQFTIEVIFWCCLVLVGYAYLGYPAAIYVFSRLFGHRQLPADCPNKDLPDVTLLIAAYNERAVIAERIENALALDYPHDKLKIVIASDGSDDGTNSIVENFSEQGVQLMPFPVRRGKSVVLNDAVRQVRGEILVLSDANTMMEPDSLRSLVRWFADENVGAVCGRLDLYDTATGRNADGVYWRYENFLKSCEGRLDAVLGANGAIYGIRRQLFQPIPPDTLIDDLTIPLLAKLHSDCRIVYDRQAIAREETAPDIQAEFRRRARIGTGGFQAMSRLWRLLDPKFGWTAFAFLSHKVLRWASPLLLIAMLFSNLLLIGTTGYREFLIAQVAFYAWALLGDRIAVGGLTGRLLRLPALFTAVNAALLVGFVRWLHSPQNGVWVRTARA